MPLIVVQLPVDTFTPAQKQQLAWQMTDALLGLEGMAENDKARSLSWTRFYEFPQNDFFIGGHAVDKPHYQVDVSIFQGTLGGDKKNRLTHELTELILSAEGTDHNLLNAARVWVMIHEIPDGNWGGAGQIYHLPDLVKMMQK